MVGLSHRWAQGILFLGAIAMVIPFLHLGSSVSRPDHPPASADHRWMAHRTVSVGVASVQDQLPERAKLRILVSD
jgi:hypothetical protein